MAIGKIKSIKALKIAEYTIVIKCINKVVKKYFTTSDFCDKLIYVLKTHILM